LSGICHLLDLLIGAVFRLFLLAGALSRGRFIIGSPAAILLETTAFIARCTPGGYAILAPSEEE
jgi:hypothetical protein